MGWLNAEKPPERWSSSYFRMFVERVRTAVNFLDTENFPNGINGLWLINRSVSLRNKITGYGGLVFNYDFFTAHTALNVTSTTLLGTGSAVLWTPQWNNFARGFLEVTARVADAAHPATLEVQGAAGTIFSTTINSTTLTRFEWEITPMPTSDMTLVFRCRTSNASFPLTVLSARIILKLTENV